jgi:metal-dependent amidase/aminoacylase/carboxypeptidase family protein
VVVAGASIIEGIQTIVSRNADPRKALVCAVYTIHAGEEEFFVADKLVLSGSVRALDKETMDMAQGRVSEIAQTIAAAYQCGCEVEMMPQVPPLVNNAMLYDFALMAAQQIVGKERVLQPEAMLGSDDFAVFGEYMPIFYYRLGVTAPGAPEAQLHHRDFCVDYGVLPIGSAVLAQAVALTLGASEE